jgi:hypothetical protein
VKHRKFDAVERGRGSSSLSAFALRAPRFGGLMPAVIRRASDAEFTLADGHRVGVQYGWRGAPEEQGFLHDVQLAACESFSTVLAPGANVYHYNHIHVDLMRRSSGRRICEPAAIPGEVVAERARARYATQHYGDPGTTGSIKTKPRRALGYSREDDDSLPVAAPGDD